MSYENHEILSTPVKLGFPLECSLFQIRFCVRNNEKTLSKFVQSKLICDTFINQKLKHASKFQILQKPVC